MNKLLQSVRNSSNNREDLVKKSIITQLSNSVKEIQYAGIEENKNSKAIDIMESANNLCTAIEAMFLHQLKDSIKHRFIRAIADVDERPEFNFWAPLLVISHRQIIDQITNLSQITTEVGQCRAWIRLALNDCLLSSYIMTMRQDSSALKSFYKTGAYVRDSELLDVAQRLIEGVEAFKTFTLPCNSSLLNTWPLPSLYLAGNWAPTLKACPVAPCADVAQSIDDKTRAVSEAGSDTCSLSSAISINSQGSSLRQMVALNEDEVLKIILSTKNKEDSVTVKQTSEDQHSTSGISETEVRSSDSDNVNYTVGNSLNMRGGWSFDENQEDNGEASPQPIPTKEPIEPELSDEPKVTDASFKALIDSYSMLSGGYIKTPDLKEVWQKFETDKYDSSPDNSKKESNSPRSPIQSFSSVRSESIAMSLLIGKISKEIGLDVQNFECAGCKHPLGITHKAKVCAFTGEYFCDTCMSSETITIPARIIHNWDFRQYPVSQKAFNFINELKDRPTIDFKTLNPYIYGAVEEMAHLQNLRNQLNFLRAYLYTCRGPIIEELQKQMWPREYMYEHIHQYSVSDLESIQNSQLAQQLEKVIQFGREHVTSCWLCSQKGFVCEVCNKPKALFPFDVDHVYRCDACSAVFHKGCLNSAKPCPKCERRKKREEEPVLSSTSE